MHADIKGALSQLDVSYSAFEHKGKPMTKEEVREVLEYGIKMGYKTTEELSDKEVDAIIERIRHGVINYRGIEILAKEDLVGGYYYHAPKLTTTIVPVNFCPTLDEMKKFVDNELVTEEIK